MEILFAVCGALMLLALTLKIAGFLFSRQFNQEVQSLTESIRNYEKPRR